MSNLSKRIERHRRERKRMHWHIDWLRQRASVVDALAIRSSDRLECSLAGAVSELADWHVRGFGASDCSCSTHLFGFEVDPRRSASFQRMLIGFRMDRFAELVGQQEQGR
jgi:sugar fermentation stimulation protein A